MQWLVEHKPDPLGANIVHLREDRRNGAGLAGRFGSPGGGVKMFDKNLVHAIIGGKKPGLRLGRVECEPCVDAWSRLPTQSQRWRPLPSAWHGPPCQLFSLNQL